MSFSACTLPQSRVTSSWQQSSQSLHQVRALHFALVGLHSHLCDFIVPLRCKTRQPATRSCEDLNSLIAVSKHCQCPSKFAAEGHQQEVMLEVTRLVALSCSFPSLLSVPLSPEYFRARYLRRLFSTSSRPPRGRRKSCSFFLLRSAAASVCDNHAPESVSFEVCTANIPMTLQPISVLAPHDSTWKTTSHPWFDYQSTDRKTLKHTSPPKCAEAIFC